MLFYIFGVIMVKLYFKNWFIYFKYSLIILLFAIIGILVSSLMISISTYLITNDKVNGLKENINLITKLTTDIYNYYFSNITSFLNNLVSSNGIKEIIIADLEITDDAAIDFANTIKLWNLISIAVMFLITYLGYYIASCKIRKKLCPRSLKRYIFVLIIKKILDLLLIQSLILYLTDLGLYALLITFALLILNTFISLFIAYVSQHKKGDKVKLLDIVNPRVMILSFVSSVLLLLMSYMIYVLFIHYIQILSIILGLPIFAYTIIITSLTPESYVLNYRKIEK